MAQKQKHIINSENRYCKSTFACVYAVFCGECDSSNQDRLSFPACRFFDIASQIVFAGVRFTLAGMVLIFCIIREKKVMIPDKEILKICSFHGMPSAPGLGRTAFLLLHRCCHTSE